MNGPPADSRNTVNHDRRVGQDNNRGDGYYGPSSQNQSMNQSREYQSGGRMSRGRNYGRGGRGRGRGGRGRGRSMSPPRPSRPPPPPTVPNPYQNNSGTNADNPMNVGTVTASATNPTQENPQPTSPPPSLEQLYLRLPPRCT